MRASARPATTSGFSSDRWSAPSISPTFRRSSSSGKLGVSSTSVSRSSPRSRSFFNTARLTVAPSRPASASRLPPTNSMAWSSSGPVRLAVPRVKSSAVRFASPGASAGSLTEPARTYARTTTIGMLGRAATSNRIPFGNTSRLARGAAPAKSAVAITLARMTNTRANRIIMGRSRRDSLRRGARFLRGEQDRNVLPFRGEIRARHSLEIGRRDRTDTRHELGLKAPGSRQLEPSQARRARVDGVLLPHERGLDLVLGTLELFVGHALLLQQLDLGRERTLESLGGVPGQRSGREGEQVGVYREVRVVPPGPKRHPLLVDQLPVQTRGASLGQDGREQLERWRIRRPMVRHVPGQIDNGKLRAGLPDDDAAIVDLRRFDRRHGRWIGPTRDWTEQLADFAHERRRCHFPHHDE